VQEKLLQMEKHPQPAKGLSEFEELERLLERYVTF